MRRRGCIVCEGDSFRLKEVNSYTIWRCGDCGLEFVHPMPSARLLKRFYKNYSDPRAQDHVLLANAAQNARHIQMRYGVSPASRLLDFGCGKNLFVKVVKPLGSGWSGYEPYSGDESLRKLQPGPYDFLTLWGVLEHLPRVRETVDGVLFKLLRQKGLIFLTTVSTETSIPYQHKPPEHVTYWTERAMRALFAPPRWKILEYRQYEMFQDPAVYLNCVLRSVPPAIRRNIRFDVKTSLIHVPTNEVFVAVRKEQER